MVRVRLTTDCDIKSYNLKNGARIGRKYVKGRGIGQNEKIIIPIRSVQAIEITP